MPDVPPSPTHLIFDCDGVLVDSEIIAVEVESRLLTEAGFPLSSDEIADRYVGLSYSAMFDGVVAQFGRSLPDDLPARIQQKVRDEFPDHLAPVAGIAGLLGRSDLPRAVASSSDLDRIHESLQLTSLDLHFERDLVLSAQMVDRGKPEPDLFLLAAERLDADPACCLVIEDSPHGVTAAQRAGMAVIGFLGGRHARPSLAARLRDAGVTDLADSAAELEVMIATAASSATTER